jgi:dUTP pyrophosphatase
MMKDINELKSGLDMIKNIEKIMTGLDVDNPEKFIGDMGIDLDEMDKYFEDSMSPKRVLNYTNDSENNEPEYAYESDSGFDLRSTEELWIQANGRLLVPTGLCFDIPDGYEIQVRSKSGLALNQGLIVLNSPGTVDSGYQGEVKVIIFNTTNERIKIEKGQKIAQAVLCPVVNGKWVNLVRVEEIGEKDRNNQGFGSTGL